MKRPGQISPKESVRIIGKEMRLGEVECLPRAESGPIFHFFVGKHTPERKNCIMERRVVPVNQWDRIFLAKLPDR